MKRYEVTLDYCVGGESGTDTYRFNEQEKALDKWAECCEIVDEIMAGRDSVERVDEDDFYGIRDRQDDDYARTYITEIR